MSPQSEGSFFFSNEGAVGFFSVVALLCLMDNNGWYTVGVYLLCGAVLPGLTTTAENKLLCVRKMTPFGDAALEVNEYSLIMAIIN